MTESLIGLGIMLVLAFLRLPIAISMGVVGIVGYAYMRDWNWAVAFATAQTKIYETGRNYALTVVPLFILMGNLVTRAGMSQELYRTAYAFIGHFRGGLAMATIAGCAGFGAICGSSIATAATFAKVAYPSMKKFGYSDALATGAIASGGTLGILIPPSTIMVIYGIMTGTSIGKLFAAGVIPGVLATLLLCLAVQYVTWRDPAAGPRGERLSWKERFDTLQGFGWFAAVGVAVIASASFGWLESDDAAVLGALAVFGLSLIYKGVTSVIALFALVMGGIYGGVFTAVEGAGVGAFGALVFALARKSLTWRALYAALVESARTTAMLFMILIGALMFAEFVNITSMPDDLKNFVTRLQMSPIMVVAVIMIIYVILGTAMEELSMILLTVPVFFPLIVHLGVDPIYFGILIVVVVEIGLISPPVGMNLFVLNTLLPQVPTRVIFRGVLPFMAIDCVRLAILIAFPILSLWLPSFMK
ncbi:MAG: C4-dicarboxylate transporter, DctM subunit [Betaproteobacteria bacterium]|jgi:TRAP-type C4-dicarboxylate transport system permease large subunit|nr:C4-dicarboxylate transporter, DctM subunit [Betaproteobacteria bacterium]